MIQGFTESDFTAYLSTEDNRIDTEVSVSQVRLLVKLINDMNGDIEYVYPISLKGPQQRYTKLDFLYNVVPDRYTGKVNLLPAGHWKYEVYEVTWKGAVNVAFGFAPATETDVLSVDDPHGIVQGLVTKGILNLTEKLGTEQVQYNQHESPDSPNYVWYGQDIDVWNPADETSMIAWYKNKVGITLDSSGNVSEWIDSSANTFDLSQAVLASRPSYTASTGGLIFDTTGVTDVLQSFAGYQLTSQFTIAFKIKSKSITGTSNILSSTTNQSIIEIGGCCNVDIYGGTGVGKNLFTTTGTIEDAYIVLTRNAANTIELTFNGIVQNTNTLTTVPRFNEIGEKFDGSIFEIMVFDSTSQALTDLINERLSNL